MIGTREVLARRARSWRTPRCLAGAIRHLMNGASRRPPFIFTPSFRARNRERTALELSSKLGEARLEALRGQLQPYLMFNALNAVSALIPMNPPAAQERSTLSPSFSARPSIFPAASKFASVRSWTCCASTRRLKHFASATGSFQKSNFSRAVSSVWPRLFSCGHWSKTR